MKVLSVSQQSKAILSTHFQHNLSPFVRCAREHLVRNARLFQRKYGPYAGNQLTLIKQVGNLIQPRRGDLNQEK